jgi:hypothetical protein
MFSEIEVNRQIKAKEQIEFVLNKLQALKHEISELRRQSEELKKLRLKARSKIMVCCICSGPIELGQEVVVKERKGSKERYYHNRCFQELWK